MEVVEVSSVAVADLPAMEAHFQGEFIRLLSSTKTMCMRSLLSSNSKID